MAEKAPNTFAKPLAGGGTLWSWQPTTRDKKAGCETAGIRYRALGTDFAAAMVEAEALNNELYAWRAGRPVSHLVKGSFGWVLSEFQKHSLEGASERYKDEVARYAKIAEGLVGKKSGIKITDRMATGLTIKTAQAALTKLAADRGSSTAKKAKAIYRAAWAEAHRLNQFIVPADNPFEAVKIRHVEDETYDASYEQLTAYISAAIAMDEIAMAVAARLCWDMHERPVEVFRSTVWSDYRPAHRPGHMLIRHEKRNTGGWQPLDDEETGESLFRELEDLLKMMPRSKHPLICVRETRRGTKVNEGDWQPITNAAKISRRICEKAKLPAEVTLASFRHGGITALGEAGAETSLMQARTKHRQRASLNRYDHSNDRKARAAQKLRLAHSRK
ncbi:hypothetical protein [Acidiphilium sp.]|uniref:hypothetical protein n=1 Tax=Acidiphilium sp. TaxID=527 RepID=UPI00258FFECB|nr:hypothetical protein [Acidiphilium sp.]